MRYAAFKALRTHRTNLANAPECSDYGFEPEDNLEGYTYQPDGVMPLYIVKDGDGFYVELWGDQYAGTLEECEVELWHGYLCELAV